jgi:putative membrane protein
LVELEADAMPLSQKERQQINTLVARFEADTGIQAVAAMTGKADVYPEIPWKAYAMGSAVGALIAGFAPPLFADWTHASLIAFDAMLVLAAGAAVSIGAALVPALGRLFLDRARAHTEAQQYARSLFLQRELFRTSQRRAVLVLLCRYERAAIVLADTGLTPYAPRAELAAIEQATGALLSRAGAVPAFELAFERIKSVLKQGGLAITPGAPDELDDDVVLEKGA